MTEAGTADDRITFAFRLATGRRPNAQESGVLRKVFDSQLTKYQAGPKDALRLLAVGDSPRNDRLPASDLAAWTVVANVILNLDEAVNKN